MIFALLLASLIGLSLGLLGSGGSIITLPVMVYIAGIPDSLFGAGIDQDGAQGVGGPLWLDWASLVPIPGINQIVGHTLGSNVRRKYSWRLYSLRVKNS